MGCRHKHKRYDAWWTRSDEPMWVTWYPEADGPLPDRIICKRCGQTLPLGPSNDAPPEVQQEMRAAELADALLEDGRLCDFTFSLFAMVGDDEERRGFSIAESNMRQHSDAWHAGHLTRQIVTHNEERKP